MAGSELSILHWFSSVQLEHEAARFLDNGEFTGELGDLVIAALSNVLQSPIVVFTSIQNLPVLVITPSHHVMNNPSPIHLAYCHDGPGHYDLAVHCSDTSDKDQSQHKRCTCGRKNPQSIGAACTTVLKKYASRCPCYNSRQACTDLCKCKNCANEFGMASTIGTTAIVKGVKRNCRQQESQKHPIRGVKTIKYLEKCEVDYYIGALTTFEKLLLLAIMHYLMDRHSMDFQCINDDQLTFLTVAFNGICDVAKSVKVQLPIFQRQAQELSHAVQYFISKQDNFAKHI